MLGDPSPVSGLPSIKSARPQKPRQKLTFSARKIRYLIIAQVFNVFCQPLIQLPGKKCSYYTNPWNTIIFKLRELRMVVSCACANSENLSWNALCMHLYILMCMFHLQWCSVFLYPFCMYLNYNLKYIHILCSKQKSEIKQKLLNLGSEH